MTVAPSLEPLDGYHPVTGRHDELLAGDGTVRSHWQPLMESFHRLGTGALLERADQTRRQLARDGVTYGAHDGEVPWPLDPIPLVVPDAEWRTLGRGVVQRAELLNLIMEDLYGPRRLLQSGAIPPDLVLADPQYLRPYHGVTVPGPKQLVLVGIDVVRGPNGSWQCFGHRTQVPSGAAYALEDRRVLSRVLPSELQGCDVQRLAPFMRMYRTALQQAAPVGVDDPVIVVLSSGTVSETSFEHASLAALLGSPLVQGSDLEVTDDGVFLQTVYGPTRVHVILRRLDAAYCDPLELDPASTLGVPGLLEACRAGQVTVINGLGSPVVENAALTALLPELSRRLLGQDLALDSARAWWCGRPDGLSHVLANLDDLIIRPASRATLESFIDTARLSGSEREHLGTRIAAAPERYVGQEKLTVGTAPVLTSNGLRPRPTVIRTFAVADGDGYFVMPGGLARSLGEPDRGETRVRSATESITNVEGAVSKDIWITGGEREQERGFWLAPYPRSVVARRAAPSARNAEDLFWTGRYAERAEATARLVRVIGDRRREFASTEAGPGPAAVKILLSGLATVTGTFPPELTGLTTESVELGSDRLDTALHAIVADDDDPGSVAHALHRLLADIDQLKDQLSVDTSMALADLDARIEAVDPRRPPGDEQIDELLSEIIQGLLSFAGLAAESLVRDDIWYFIDAGRRMERAVHLCRLLSATLIWERTAPTESLVIESVLMATESIITYRRRYRSHASVATVIELLLIDGENPRSLRYQLDRLEHGLLALARRHERQGVADEAVAVVREAGRVLGEFEAASPVGDQRFAVDENGRRLDLQGVLSDVADRMAFASVLVTDAFFTRPQPVRSVITPVEVPGLATADGTRFDGETSGDGASEDGASDDGAGS